MPSKSNTLDAFYALLKAGLWEQSIRLSPFFPIDFDSLYKLAEEQTVVGLIAAGLEHVDDITLSKQQVMPFMKNVFSFESRNVSMNIFIRDLIEKLAFAGIHVLLVKGQGIARCYARPLWRSAGDIDLLLDAENYEKAKAFLMPLSSSQEKEDVVSNHYGMTIDSWLVELHGSLHCGISKRIDAQIDIIQEDVFENDEVRVWNNGGIEVMLPGESSDALFVFTHILQHFYHGGIGLRQICDWCRLLWTYRHSINRGLLERQILEMKLMTEWKTFGAFAVEYLGIPVETMPFYDPSVRWKRKALRINFFVLEVGNFGRKRDMSYIKKYPLLIRKLITFSRSIIDLFCHLTISPTTSLRVFCRRVFVATRLALKGIYN